MSEAGTLTPPEEAPASADAPTYLHGVVAQFETVDDILAAAAKCRDHGFTNWDCHTPFPVHGLDKAMGVRNTVLPWLVFCGGLTGFLTGIGLQYFTNVMEYPFVISGKPMASWPVYVPVVFELTVLFSALTTFFGMWGMNGLPQLHHPLFFSERFKRASDDRFFVSVLSDDPKFDAAQTTEFLKGIGATHVDRLEE